MKAVDMNHMDNLEHVQVGDLHVLHEKEKTYRGSWKARGGVGAFMMVARKWDRLENMVEASGYDVFAAMAKDGGSGEDGTVLAELRDLRRYLLLIEAEYLAKLSTPEPKQPGRAVVRDRTDEYEERQDAQRASKTLEPAPVPATDSNKHGLQPQPGNHGPALRADGKPLPTNPLARGEDVDGISPALAERSVLARRTVLVGVPKNGGPPDVLDPGTQQWSIVDRLLETDDAKLQHLPKLRRGLNHVEWKQGPPYYAHMYQWNDGRTEYTLQRQYERWAVTGGGPQKVYEER